MHSADWTQLIIGVLGVIATIIVAAMVYRLERKDRKKEVAQIRASEKASEKTKQLQIEERDKRDLRRMQHQDDYQAAKRALNILDNLFEKGQDALLTSEELEAQGLEQILEEIAAISKRVSALTTTLTSVYMVGSNLSIYSFPEPWQFASAFRKQPSESNSEPDFDFSEVGDLMRDCIFKGIAQVKASNEGAHAVKAARDAIAREWGGYYGARQPKVAHPACRRPDLWGAGPPAVVMVELPMEERPSPPPAALLVLSWDVENLVLKRPFLRFHPPNLLEGRPALHPSLGRCVVQAHKENRQFYTKPQCLDRRNRSRVILHRL